MPSRECGIDCSLTMARTLLRRMLPISSERMTTGAPRNHAAGGLKAPREIEAREVEADPLGVGGAQSHGGGAGIDQKPDRLVAHA